MVRKRSDSPVMRDEEDREEQPSAAQRILDQSRGRSKTADAVSNAPTENKADGWWQIVKLERDGAAITENTVHWEIADRIGSDAYDHLRKLVKDQISIDEGDGEYLAKPCDESRQLIRGADFFHFKVGAGEGSSGGQYMDMEREDIRRQEEELKYREKKIRIDAMEARLKEKEAEISGKGRVSPHAAEWVAFFQENEMPLPEDMSTLPAFAPPKTEKKKDGPDPMMMMMMTQMMSQPKADPQVEILKQQLEIMRQELSKPKDDPMTTLLMQQMAEEKLRREEYERKREEEDRRREEKIREERRIEEEKRRQELTLEQQRREDQRRWEYEQKKDDQRRFEMQMQNQREEARMREESNRTDGKNQQAMMFQFMQMLNEDKGGARNQMMDMMARQAEFMQQASANQFNMGLQATTSMLDLTERVRNMDTGGGEKEDSGTFGKIMEHAASILGPYAEADARARTAQNLGSQYGVDPRLIQQQMDQERIGMEAPPPPPHMIGGVPQPVNLSPAAPSYDPAPAQGATGELAGYSAPVPEGSAASAPMPTTNVNGASSFGENESTPVQQSGPDNTSGGEMSQIIGQFAAEVPDVWKTVGFCVKDEVDPESALNDAVELFVFQPAIVRTIILRWPYSEIKNAVLPHLDDSTKAIFEDAETENWWNAFKKALSEEIKALREEGAYEDEEESEETSEEKAESEEAQPEATQASAS
jgi:hypothetical protein